MSGLQSQPGIILPSLQINIACHLIQHLFGGPYAFLHRLPEVVHHHEEDPDADHEDSPEEPVLVLFEYRKRCNDVAEATNGANDRIPGTNLARMIVFLPYLR